MRWCAPLRRGCSRGSPPGAAPTRGRSHWCRATTCPTTAPSRHESSATWPRWSIRASPLGWGTPSRPSRRWSTASRPRRRQRTRARWRRPRACPTAARWSPSRSTNGCSAAPFPGGRPRWEDAGAILTDDVEPFEQRKLWLLNGGHSLLAYAGSVRGHATVAEAIADDTCRAWLEEWWAEASAHLSLPADDITAYREALLDRFANPRMRHRLDQIAADGSQKLPVRILPVLRRERSEGRTAARRDTRARRLGVPPARARRAGEGRAGRRGRPARRPDRSRKPSPRILGVLDPASPRTTSSRRPCAPTPRSSSVKAGRDAGAALPRSSSDSTSAPPASRQWPSASDAPWQRVAIREYPLLQPSRGLAGAGPRGDHGRGGHVPWPSASQPRTALRWRPSR